MTYPLKFHPIFKQRIWGGRRLAELFDHFRDAAAFGEGPVGEIWQLSGLPGDESVVANGPLAGATLTELVQRLGGDLLGEAAAADGRFPLLIKLLDARRPLSVQVHPARARQPGCFKDECWYVIDADPDARLWLGLRRGVDRERLAAAVRAGQVEPLLCAAPARPGDAFHLSGGTVHALGGGLVVAEVQTPSDTTYRLFDWNRIDPATGGPRPLHLDQALDAIDFAGPQPRPTLAHRGGAAGAAGPLVRGAHFTVEMVRIAAGVERDMAGGQMMAWQMLAGRGEVRHGPRGESVGLTAGELLLLPAALRDARIRCHTDCAWLQIGIPANPAAGRGSVRG